MNRNERNHGDVKLSLLSLVVVVVVVVVVLMLFGHYSCCRELAVYFGREPRIIVS